MSVRVVGRYRIFEEFAAGGMASIHFGRLGGEGGFTRLVAIKRLHPQFTRDAEFVRMFMDEARVAGRIQHPNVAGVVDVVRADAELFLVMDYVHGESLSRMLKLVREAKTTVPPAIAARLAVDMLQGLHAAHEATGEFGAPLEIVHRDVSPQNLLVGIDGIARVVDFGVAKAQGRMQETVDGSMKGKLAYFSPEQLQHAVDRRTDVFAASIVLWETLLAKRLFSADTQWEIAQAVLTREIVDPSKEDAAIPAELGAVVMKGLSRDVEARYQTAREMAVALEASMPIASHSTVADWVRGLAGALLDERRERIARSEELESDLVPPRSVGRRAPAEASSEEHPTSIERTPAPTEPDASEGKTARRAKSEMPPPATARPRARASTLLIVLATAGITLGIAGLAFAYAIWSRDRAEPAPTMSRADSAAPRERPEADARPTTSATSTASAEPSGAGTPEPTTSSAASATARAPAAAKGPRPLTELEKNCRASEGGIVCDNQCFPMKSRQHCGKCGNDCGPHEICDGTKCVTPKCVNPEINCPYVGCVNVFSFNSSHCGGCGRVCFGPCVNGQCQRK